MGVEMIEILPQVSNLYLADAFGDVENDQAFSLTFYPMYNYYGVNYLIRLTWTATNFAWFKMRKRLPKYLQTGKIQ